METRFRSPRERLAALADEGAFVEHDADAPSPYLGRYGIAPQRDDGVVAATLAIGGVAFEAVAQDARFLRGSVGARHGAKIAAAIARARGADRPLLALAASGGVRLHEANAAELALGHALRALCDARAAGMPALAIGVGDVFGGMSVLAAACDALALVPGVRFGLSGPRVIATAQRLATHAGSRAPAAIDVDDRDAVDRVFGAAARAAQGMAVIVDDDVAAQRAWLAATLAAMRGRRVGHDGEAPAGDGAMAAAREDFDARLRAEGRGLAALAGKATSAPRLSIDGNRATLAPFVRELDAAALAAVDALLLELPREVATLVIVEDSRGHEASVAAEGVVLSRYLAHHALVLAALRARGMAIVGVVAGTGHSAAFFANALQAHRLYALPGARIVAMEPAALAGVTGIDRGSLAQAVEDDPLLGHPARHFEALAGLRMIATMSEAR